MAPRSHKWRAISSRLKVVHLTQESSCCQMSSPNSKGSLPDWGVREQKKPKERETKRRSVTPLNHFICNRQVGRGMKTKTKQVLIKMKSIVDVNLLFGIQDLFPTRVVAIAIFVKFTPWITVANGQKLNGTGVDFAGSERVDMASVATITEWI